MKVKLIAIIAALPVAGLLTLGIRYELLISPDFRAQIKILQAATKEREQDQENQEHVNLLEMELKNDELAVENDNLDVQIANLKGKTPPYAKLNSDEAQVRTLQAVLNTELSLPDKDIYPAPDMVAASLPSHAHTVKDNYLIHRLHESSVLDDEATACYSSKTDVSVAHPDCDALEKKAEEEGQYVLSAAK